MRQLSFLVDIDSDIDFVTTMSMSISISVRVFRKSVNIILMNEVKSKNLMAYYFCMEMCCRLFQTVKSRRRKFQHSRISSQSPDSPNFPRVADRKSEISSDPTEVPRG